MNLKEMKLMISGRVQGVGFRHYTRTNAGELGIKGWVRNLDNGDVEALLQGPEEKLNLMLEKLKSGPMPARVDNIDIVEEKESPEKEEKTFRVVH
ncbi:MAG: acylphosphatase [Rhodohalobacter sp.]|nr:acylphosphatase [Rhodohalobacter sp.]